MTEKSIKRECPRCCGEGAATVIIGPGATDLEDPCSKCGGSGQFASYYLVDDLVETYLIVEATATAEYNALSDVDKARYNLIVSLGKVDLGAGTKVRSALLAMFPVGTDTRTALAALVS